MKKLSLTLAKVKSIRYLTAFFVAIPIYACIYSSFPRAFKSSTTTLEPSINIQKIELASALEDEILNPSGLAPSSRVQVPEVKSIKIKDSSFFLSFGEVTPNFIFGRIILRTVDTLINEYEWYGDFQLSAYQIDNKYKKRVYQKARPIEISIKWMRYPNDSITTKDQEELEHLIFKSPFGSMGSISYYVPKVLFMKFRNFFDTLEGLPSGFIKSYPRMLYFSIITITTLGYGDIVPINQYSRFFVSLEALTGVLLIGLFLNSLAHESKN